MLKYFFIGFIRIHILHHANEEPIFGTQMIEELARHGYKISPGTLYPILHLMEENGYLESYQEAFAGKVRKYYTITQLGKAALNEAKKKIKELTDELMN